MTKNSLRRREDRTQAHLITELREFGDIFEVLSYSLTGDSQAVSVQQASIKQLLHDNL